MKNYLVIAAAALLSLVSCSHGADCGRHGLVDSKDWFIVKDITPQNGIGKVYLISEQYKATAYLVTGSKGAMLIDTGYGIGDFAGLVRSLTPLPLVVVNTHGHVDHVAGDYQFSQIWLPAKDMDIYSTTLPWGDRDVEAYAKANLAGFDYDQATLSKNAAEVAAYEPNKVNLFDEGKTWDLGGKVIKTVELAGHTPGSMMFVDEADDMLFSGDAMNGQLWMWLDHCLSLEEYAANLRAAMPKFMHLSRIYGGHELSEEGVPMSQAQNILRDVESVLAGEHAPEITPAPMPVGRDSVKVYTFETWQVIAK